MAVRSRRNLCGGWTLAWQGGDEDRFPGDMATIFTALQQEFPDAEIVHLDVPVDTQPKKGPANITSPSARWNSHKQHDAQANTSYR